MQDYPTNDRDRLSLLYWMNQGLSCNIVPRVDPELSEAIEHSQLDFEHRLLQRDLIQGRARRVREESVDKATRLARETKALWHHARNAIALLGLDPEIADLLGVPAKASKMPSDRAEYWIGAVDTILRGRARAEELGLPEYVLVPYARLEQQREALHALNTRYTSLRNDHYHAGEAVKVTRERVDFLIRKLTANLRYLLCERTELEQRQIMRRFGFTFHGDARPETEPTPAEPEPPAQDRPDDEADQQAEPTAEPEHTEKAPDPPMGQEPPQNEPQPAQPDPEAATHHSPGGAFGHQQTGGMFAVQFQ